MKLIVGLGNPGKKYQKTRHNAGFMAVDSISDAYNFSEYKKSDKHKAEIAEGKIWDEKVLLTKPQTFMNLTGKSVQSILNFYKIPINDLIVIYDDIALPQGSLRIRMSGSAGGHNGMKSIIQELGTEDFVRIRIGIEPLTEFKGALENYVLGKLTAEESALMDDNLKKIPDLVRTLLKDGIDEAMQRFN